MNVTSHASAVFNLDPLLVTAPVAAGMTVAPVLYSMKEGYEQVSSGMNYNDESD